MNKIMKIDQNESLHVYGEMIEEVGFEVDSRGNVFSSEFVEFGTRTKITQSGEVYIRGEFSENGSTEAIAPTNNVITSYVSWVEDPTSSIVIVWHQLKATSLWCNEVQIRKSESTVWSEPINFVSKVDFDHSDRVIKTAYFSGLEANTSYFYRFTDNEKTYKFKTMKSTINEGDFIRIAMNGDLYDGIPNLGHEEALKSNTKRMMSYNPDFLITNGDMAHADNSPTRVTWWHDVFASYENYQIDQTGHRPPILASIGNHEFLGGYSSGDYDEASQFFQAYPFPGRPAYGHLDFGEYLTIIVLDTELYNKQQQASWMEGIIQERQDGRLIIPYYHTAGYGSHYDGNLGVREHWYPIFNRYENIRFVLESHNHVFARSKPIRDGQEHDGIITIGQGGFASRARATHQENSPVFEKIMNTANSRHSFWMVDVYKNRNIHIRCIDLQGVTIDDFTIDSEGVITNG